MSVFPGVSIAFNVAVSPDTWISRATHAIPPITLIVSVEILLSVVQSDLSTALPVHEHEHEPNTRSVTSPVTMLHLAVTPDVTTQQLLQFYRDNPSASYVTAASHLNINRQTVSRHISRLLESGKIFREGNRFVIPDPDTQEFVYIAK